MIRGGGGTTIIVVSMALVRKMDLLMILVIMVAVDITFQILQFANQVIIIKMLRKKKVILADECLQTGLLGENTETQTSSAVPLMVFSPSLSSTHSLTSSLPSLFEVMKKSARFVYKRATKSDSLIYSSTRRTTSSETFLRRISLVMYK